jgi:cyclophilin family peptidyl-prolyl cis-trans isomerase
MKKSQTQTFLGTFAIILGALFMMSASGCDQNGVSDSPRRAIIHTEFGDITVQLSDSTPQHRDNFIKIAEEGFYDNLLFHRVMKGFMVQGGDPESLDAEAGKRLGGGGPGYTIEAEMKPGLVHVKGALAAARQPDSVNPEKKSSGSQFYLVHGKTWKPGELMSLESKIQAQFPEFAYTDEMKTMYYEEGGAPFLDMNYTVFGFVVDGLDIIDSIAAVKVAAGNRPVDDVKFSVEVLK